MINSRSLPKVASKEYAKLYGLSDGSLDESRLRAALKAINLIAATLEQLAAPNPLASVHGAAARNLIYHAIRLAQVDGYNDISEV